MGFCAKEFLAFADIYYEYFGRFLLSKLEDDKWIGVQGFSQNGIEYCIKVMTVHGCKRIPQREWLNGYIFLNEDHPWFGLDCESLNAIDVHGGITYASHASQDSGFITQMGFKKRWMIGFDCAHYGDNMKKCNIEFVRNELEKLCKQAIEALKVKK